MNITECVPLAGRGLVARRGHLVALTGGTDAGPDPLLTALTAVAYANGDEAALVLAGTRATAEHGGRPAWACAGVTFGEEVAVLVHGEAAALVCVDGIPETQVTASGSMIPVAGTFTGAVVTVRLVIGLPAPPDPRLWLEAGTVFGGGIALTIRQDKPGKLIPNDPYAPAAATVRPAIEQAAVNMALHPSSAGPAAPAVPAPPGVAPGEVYPEDMPRLVLYLEEPMGNGDQLRVRVVQGWRGRLSRWPARPHAHSHPAVLRATGHALGPGLRRGTPAVSRWPADRCDGRTFIVAARAVPADALVPGQPHNDLHPEPTSWPSSVR